MSAAIEGYSRCALNYISTFFIVSVPSLESATFYQGNRAISETNKHIRPQYGDP